MGAQWAGSLPRLEQPRCCERHAVETLAPYQLCSHLISECTMCTQLHERNLQWHQTLLRWLMLGS